MLPTAPASHGSSLPQQVVNMLEGCWGPSQHYSLANTQARIRTSRHLLCVFGLVLRLDCFQKLDVVIRMVLGHFVELSFVGALQVPYQHKTATERPARTSVLWL